MTSSATLLAWSALVAAAPPANGIRPGSALPESLLPAAVSPSSLREECALCGPGNVAELMLTLASAGAVEERLAAVAGLARAPGEPARLALALAMARDEAPEVRSAAATALGERREWPALPALLQAAADNEASVRLAALRALSTFPLPEARDLLRAAALSASRDSSEREAALRALAAHGTQEAHADIVSLARSLEGRDGDPLAALAAQLAAAPAPCATCREPQRLRMLTSLLLGDPSERRWAVRDLGPADLPLTAKLRALEVALRDSDAGVRETAVMTTAGLSHDSELALRLLVEVAVTSDEPESGSKARALVATRPNEPVVEALLSTHALDARPEVAVRAVVLLARDPGAGATAGLARACGHADGAVAGAALNALLPREAGAELRGQALATALGHSDASVAELAVMALSPREAAEHAPAVVALLGRTELSEEARARACEVLAPVPGDEVSQALVRRLSDPTRRVREAAIAALALRADATASASLAALTDTPSLEIVLANKGPLTDEQLHLLLTRADATDAAKVAFYLADKRAAGRDLGELMPVVRAGLAHPDPEVSRLFLTLLGPPSGPLSPDALTVLAAAMKEARSEASAVALYDTLDRAAASDLDAVERELVATRRLPTAVRRRALLAVAARNPADFDPWLERYTRDGDAEVAALATRLRSAGVGAVSMSETLEPNLPWRGRWPLALYMTGLGAIAFGEVAGIAEVDAGPRLVSYTAGGIVGGATALLLPPLRDVSFGQATIIGTETLWAGLGARYLAKLGRLDERLDLPGSDRGAGILAGVAAVATSGALTLRSPWRGRDAAFVNAAGLEVALLTRTLASLTTRADPGDSAHTARDNALAVGAGWALGVLPASLLVDELSPTKHTPMLVYAMGLGSWLGAFAALSRDNPLSTGEAAALGIIGGQAAGFLGATMVGPFVDDFSARDAGRLTLVSGLGAVAGMGAALAWRPREDAGVGALGLMVDAGTLAALGLGLTIPGARDFGRGKGAMMTLATAYGAVAGSFLPLLDTEYGALTNGRRNVGGAMLGASLGLLSAAAVAPYVDPSSETLKLTVATTLTATMAGTGAALLSCRFVDARCPSRQRSTAFIEGGAAAGLLAGALAAERIPASLPAASDAAALAALGAWNAVVLARYDERFDGAATTGAALTAASLAGASGYLGAAALDLDPSAGWLLLAGYLAGNGFGAAVGNLIPESSARARLSLTVAGPFALAAAGGLASLAYDTPPSAEPARLTLSAAWGALHGGLLPYVWEPEAPRRRQRAAGGSVTGAVTALALAYATTPLVQEDRVTEAFAISAAADLFGYGLGLYADAEPHLTTLAAGAGGLAVGLALSPWTRYERGDLNLLLAAGPLGAWTGWLATQGREAHVRAGAALMGASTLALSAWLFEQGIDTPRGSADIATIAGATAAGNTLGYGLGLFVADNHDVEPAALAAAAGLLIGTVTTGVAPRLELSAVDIPIIVLASSVGTASGYWAPELGRGVVSAYLRKGGLCLGGAAGLLAGTALSQGVHLRPGASFELAVAYAAGSTLGRGVGGLTRPDDLRVQSAAQLGVGALALSAAALWQPYTEYTAEDFGLASMAVAIAIWHGQIGRLRAPDSDAAGEEMPLTKPRARFASMAAGGLAGLGAMGLAQVKALEYRWSDILEIGIADAVGNAIGYGASLMDRNGSARRRVWAQQIAGLGLVAGALAAAPQTSYDLSDSITLALGAGMGGWLGSFAPSTWREEVAWRERTGGLLLGGGVGLLTAALASQHPAVDYRVGLAGAAGFLTLSLVGDGATQLFFFDLDRSGRARAMLGTAAGTGIVLSGLALGLAAADVDVARDFDRRAAAAGALAGGISGAWLFSLRNGPQSARRVAAGFELAVPLASAFAGIMGPRLGRDHRDFGEAAVGMLAGQLIAADTMVLTREVSFGEPAVAWAAEAGGLLGFATALYFAPRTELTAREAGYALTTAAAGGFYGWYLSLDDSRSDDEASRRGWATALLGGSLGLLAGGAGSQALHLSAGDTAESVVTATLLHLTVSGGLGLTEASARTRRTTAGLSALAGYALASVLSPSSEYRGTDYGVIALAGSLGGLTGWRLVSHLEEEPTGEQRWRGVSSAAALGTLGGMLISRHLQLEPASFGYAAFGAAAGNVLGWGFGQLGSREARSDLTDVGMTVGGIGLAVAGGALGDRVRLERANAGLIAFMGLAGAWHGTWLPRSWNDSPVDDDGTRQLAGGALLGTGVGLLTGAAFAHYLGYSGADVAETGMGWVASNSFGAGLGLLLSEDDRLAVGLMEGVGVAGTLALARYAPETKFAGEDWLLGVLATAHGAWQGVGTTRLFGRTSARDTAGGILLCTSVGGVAGALIGQRSQLSMPEVLASFSGTLWGSWLGAWIAYSYEEELDVDIAGLGALGSDIGLALTSMAVSRIGNMPPARVGWINFFGVTGALAGAGVGTFVPVDKNVQKGNIIGTGAGLLAGVLITGLFDIGTSDVTPEDDAREVPAGAADGSLRLPSWVPELDIVMPVVGPVMPIDSDTPVDSSAVQFGLTGVWH